MSRAVIRLLPALMSFPLIFLLQLYVGSEIALFPLYLLPVIALSWRFGWKGVLISSLATTALWIVSKELQGHAVTHEWIRIYNGGVRGFICALFGALVLVFRSTVEAHRARMEAMRALLNVCHGCGAVQGSDGHWVPMAELQALREAPQICECPACADRQRQSAKA